ncbi:MAG: serine/threonine protein kinase, partial [Planctomycetes bacterium]|nr:serine/threonine protein kinase [Planctomycetota bacterium]
IKPGNIMIGREGEPVVLDFGLAQNEDEAHLTLTQTGDFFGTPAYMSPEQISAHRIRLDRRTDIFSLAATLYEITVGRRPFDAGTREGLYQAILTKQCPDPRKQNPKISRDLAVVLLTALEKDRDRRYPTALEFAEELRRVRVYEPIKARPAGPLLKSLRWAQRNRGLTAMIILAVLAAIVSGAFFNRQARLESRREEQARMVVLRRELDEKIDRLREASGQGALGNLIFSGAALDVAHRLRNLGKEGDERMKAFLQSDNPAERKLGMDIIPFLSIDDWIEELATIAMSDEKLAILASNILMRAQTPEVIPMLHHLVDESDSEGVRLNSLFGLCQLKDDRGIQAMLEQVKDPTKPYWDGVVGGILALRGPEVRPIYDEIVPRLLDKTHAPDALVMLLDYYRSLGEIERSKSTGIRILASDERIPDELRQQAEALLKSPD